MTPTEALARAWFPHHTAQTLSTADFALVMSAIDALAALGYEVRPIVRGDQTWQTLTETLGGQAAAAYIAQAAEAADREAAGREQTEPFEDTPQGRSAQGGCPVHGVPWVVRPAGTSKATGAPYNAFWHCNEQDADGTFCRQKPTPAWVKAHPIRG